MNNLAPILIMTMNRIEHFKRCIESLGANLNADKTDIYIALDYPLTDEHWIGYKKIISFIDTITGFKSINVIKRNVNYGIKKNYLESMNEILKIHDRIIFTEDDNEFSNDFLSFMNRCLKVYKENQDIFSISGYNYPISISSSYPYEVYKWMGYSAWGFGIWKEKWEIIDWDQESALTNVKEFLKNYQNVITFNKVANHYIPALILMLEKNQLHGDAYISMCQFINSMYSVFPKISRVRNIGHDGSGANCVKMQNDIYAEQEIYSGSGFYELPIDIKSDDKINRILEAHFRFSSKSKLKTASKLFLINIGLYNPGK